MKLAPAVFPDVGALARGPGPGAGGAGEGGQVGRHLRKAGRRIAVIASRPGAGNGRVLGVVSAPAALLVAEPL